jgi:hypothetical protein
LTVRFKDIIYDSRGSRYHGVINMVRLEGCALLYYQDESLKEFPVTIMGIYKLERPNEHINQYEMIN